MSVRVPALAAFVSLQFSCWCLLRGAAPTASARTAEIELWAATLTVADFSVGNDDFTGFQADNAGTFSPDTKTFTDGDVPYIINTLALDSGHLVFEFLWFTLDRCLHHPAQVSPRLELHVGTETTLPFSELQSLQLDDEDVPEPSCFGAYRWLDSGLSWSSGEEVQLRITTKVELPRGRLSFEENDEANHNVHSITRGGTTVTATFRYEQHTTAADDTTIALEWGGQPLTGELLGGDISIAAGGDRGTTTLTAGSGTPHYDVPVTRTLEAIVLGHVVASDEFTVFDDDVRPSATIGVKPGRTSEESGRPAEVTVTLNPHGLGTPVDVVVTTNDPNGRLVDSSDRTLTFGTGETSKSVTYAIVDNDDEDSEFPVTFYVQQPKTEHQKDSFLLGDPHAVDLVITDTDERKPRLGIRGVTGQEGDTVQFDVYLDPPEDENVTVDYRTVDGTAVAGQDFDATSGTLTIRAGSHKGVIEVPLRNDSVNDDHETFEMVLSNIAGGDARFSSTRATGTIRDGTGPEFWVSAAEAEEGTDEHLTFTVGTLHRGTKPISVRYRTKAQTATANEDYYVKSGTLRFGSSEGSKSVQVRVLDDETIESTETLLLELFEPVGAEIDDATGTGTIRDDEVGALISISDARMLEGSVDQATLQVLLEPALDVPVTVNYATADGTAVAGSDYSAATSQVTFDPDDTEKLILIDIIDDDEGEDVETFTVTLEAPEGGLAGDAVLQDATGLVRILDMRFDVQDAVGNEDDGTIDFTVTLTRPDAVGNVTGVGYRTTTRPGDTATPGSDYTHVDNTLGFMANETEKTVSVPIIDDSVEDDGETFHLELYSPTVGDLGRKLAKGTIRNDEAEVVVPSVSIADAEGEEGDGIAFTLTLSEATTVDVSVEYATSSGTATDGSDFSDTSGTLSFSAGTTAKTVTVSTTEDSNDEDDETFTVTLSNPQNATLGDATATGTITNRDGDEDSPQENGNGADSENAATLTGFTLINANTNTGAGAITEGKTFILDDPAKGSYAVTVQAASGDDAPGSVGIVLSGPAGHTQTENIPPYSLYGDDGTNPTGRVLPPGDYTITATAYPEENLDGTALETITVSFTVKPTLTARIGNEAQSHDGSASFTFEIHFSEDLKDDFSYETLRDHALTISGGTVDKAQRKHPDSDERNKSWTVTATPSGDGDVVIGLPKTTSCSATGAICTQDERKLSTPLELTVPGLGE